MALAHRPLGVRSSRDGLASKPTQYTRWRGALGALLLLSVCGTLVHMLMADLLPSFLYHQDSVKVSLRIQQSYEELALYRSREGTEAAAAAAAGDNASADPWSPQGRQRRARLLELPGRQGRLQLGGGGNREGGGDLLPPSSIAAWRCEDGSPEAEAAASHSRSSSGSDSSDSALPFSYDLVMKSKAWVKAYGDQVSRYKWCRGEVPWLVPQLRNVALLRSSKPRPERGVTVVTQLSLERLGMLENQCRLWPNQIAAVLYIPLTYGRIFSDEDPAWNGSSLDVGIAQALRFHAAMEATDGHCILDLELVAEERCSGDRAMLYPANAVRNRALRLVKTEAVLLMDVDFIPSNSLAQLLADKQQYMQLMDTLEQKYAVVLPAFEPLDQGEEGKQLALDAVALGKGFVSKQFSWRAMVGFHMEHYPKGHKATNYARWSESSEMFNVTYELGFEPYILVKRKYVPWYDERFRGYYWNKVQQLMHLATQLNFTFAVHPTAFVVHLPHRKAATKFLTRKSGQKQRNHKIFLLALSEMHKGRFVPVTSFPMECLQRTQW